jgi:hypothetical protein
MQDAHHLEVWSPQSLRSEVVFFQVERGVLCGLAKLERVEMAGMGLELQPGSITRQPESCVLPLLARGWRLTSCLRRQTAGGSATDTLCCAVACRDVAQVRISTSGPGVRREGGTSQRKNNVAAE